MDNEISRCSDCLLDISSHGSRQYYMANNEVWIFAMKKGRVKFLCMECLEKRIGRNLISDDFQNISLNYQSMFSKHTSEILKNRLGKKFTSSLDFKDRIIKEYNRLRFQNTKQYERHKEIYDLNEKRLIELADSGDK